MLLKVIKHKSCEKPLHHWNDRILVPLLQLYTKVLKMPFDHNKSHIKIIITKTAVCPHDKNTDRVLGPDKTPWAGSGSGSELCLVHVRKSVWTPTTDQQAPDKWPQETGNRNQLENAVIQTEDCMLCKISGGGGMRCDREKTIQTPGGAVIRKHMMHHRWARSPNEPPWRWRLNIKGGGSFKRWVLAAALLSGCIRP